LRQSKLKHSGDVEVPAWHISEIATLKILSKSSKDFYYGLKYIVPIRKMADEIGGTGSPVCLPHTSKGQQQKRSS
jgi:hypothetical protein